MLLRASSAASRRRPLASAAAGVAARAYHSSDGGGFGGGPGFGSGSGSGALHGNALGFAATTPMMPPFAFQMHATTILAVRKGGRVAVVGDGQVTRGGEVAKGNAVKVRRIGAEGSVISGFAGSTADCLALRERLETKLEEHPGQLMRACVELAKEWRTEKYLRRLEAVMLVVDRDVSLTITGLGDVMEPADAIIAIGSRGSYALAAARALLDGPLDAMQIAEKSMRIAAEMCIYTNTNFVKDEIDSSSGSGSSSGSSTAPPVPAAGAKQPALA